MIGMGEGFRVSYGLPNEHIFTKFSIVLRDYLYLFKQRSLHLFMYLALSIEPGTSRCFPSHDYLRKTLHLDKETFLRSLRTLENIRIEGRPLILKVSTRVKDPDRPLYFQGPNTYIICPTEAEVLRYTGRTVLIDGDHRELGFIDELKAGVEIAVAERSPLATPEKSEKNLKDERSPLETPPNKTYKKIPIKEESFVETEVSTDSELADLIAATKPPAAKPEAKPKKEREVVVLPGRYESPIAMTPAAWYESMLFTYNTCQAKNQKLVAADGTAVTTNTILHAALAELYPSFYASKTINYQKLYAQLNQAGLNNHIEFVRALFKHYSPKVNSDPVWWTIKCWKDSQPRASKEARQNQQAVAETVERLNDLTALLPGQGILDKLSSLRDWLQIHEERGNTEEVKRTRAAIEYFEKQRGGVRNAS